MSEPGASNLVSVDRAIAIIDSAPVTPRVLKARLEEAQGLRLAQDICADRDYPPFDKSLMDGYAVRCQDVKLVPVELEVIGEIAAGQVSPVAIGPGQSMAIMTGAPLPVGADGVVPVEETEQTAERVTIRQTATPEHFIARRGADCAAGSIVLARGTKLEAAQLAVAASVGAAWVDVFARPRVAVLSTGDELVSIRSAPGPAQIRNANNLMLVALLKRFGCEVADQGIVSDDRESIRNAIEQGMTLDVLLVSGGMSMGRYDFVPMVLLDLGVELEIERLRIKPGKPFVFARGTKTFVFGLPGNPVSAFVCAVRLCSRLLARLGGGDATETWRPAALESPLEANGPREFYQPAIVAGANVKPLKWKGSADIYTLAAANGLIVRAENAPPLPADAMVNVLEIPV